MKVEVPFKFMADVHSVAIRSYNMSQIRSKNTKPEMIVRKFLHNNGFRYRLHVKNLSGKPDIVLSKYKTIVFVQGCFWHGHENCVKFRIPKTNTEWWTNKILVNKKRDNLHRTNLETAGWKVLYIWECNLQLEQLVTLANNIVDNKKS
jgi:DNA mismatch endonuclease (patch repair protein)